jgi:DNA-directed RNA polymerase subunit RPC12/RpoP
LNRTAIWCNVKINIKEGDKIMKKEIERAIDFLNVNYPTSKYATELSEAYTLALQALEKQVPRKPNKTSYKPLKNIGWEYECPTCKSAVGINNNDIDYTQEDNYCPSCGQKLDWNL